MKVYPTFDSAGFIFNADRSSACRWAHRLLSVLENTLNEKLVLPKRKMKNLKELFEFMPGLKTVIVDVAERPICRPVDNKKQKLYYSGKKKRHMIKNTILTRKDKKILYMSGTEPGTQHDYKMFKEEKLAYALPDDVTFLLDKAYQGVKTDYPNLKVRMPKKKPNGKMLSQTDKNTNKAISKKRIYVEHAIGGIKRLGIVSNVFRNTTKNFDDKAMFVAAGIWNFYLR